MARRFPFSASALFPVFLFTCAMRPVAVAQEDAGPGAAVYAKSCAVCHDKTAPRMPSRSVLQQRSATFILKTLNSGVMKEQGAALSVTERTEVAHWLGEENCAGDRSGHPCESLPGRAHFRSRIVNLDQLGWRPGESSVPARGGSRAHRSASGAPQA